MVAGLRQSGWAAVEPRGSGNPFMSDERSLFHSLAGTLATVLENVRFREEQHRQLERENSSVSSSAAPNLKRCGPKSIRISFSTRSMPLPASTRAGRSDH